jgi:hypothetical protein
MFEGTVCIDFMCTFEEIEKVIFLDYVGQIKSIIINDVNNSVITHKDNRIYIDRSVLLRGPNKILINFKSFYSLEKGKICGLKYLVDNQKVV